MSRQEKAAQAGKARNWNEVTPMSLYSRHVLPLLTHLAMRNKAMAAERARWIPMATGVVLEIGMGSGLNVPFYGPNVAKLYALEPSEQLRLMAIPRATRAAFPVELLAASAEAIPLPPASVEWLVTTWTLCSIADPVAALREFQRVLRPEGRVLFVEHGRSPMAGLADSGLAKAGRGLPSESAHRSHDRRGRFRDRGAGAGLHPRTTLRCLSVSGVREILPATVARTPH
jgi:ubiquinone/menaquinone biosynthesis C-methylase UbiE